MPYPNDLSIPEAFGLDPKVVEKLAIAYQGYALLRAPEALPTSPSFHPSLKRQGTSLPQGPWRWPARLRVGYLARAASYWATLDAARARRCYSDAAGFAREEKEIAERTAKEQARLGRVSDAPEGDGASFQVTGVVLRAMPLSVLAGTSLKNTAAELEGSQQILRAYPTPETIRIILSAASTLTLIEHEPYVALWREVFSREAERFYAAPVGRLGIPLSFYLEFSSFAGERYKDKTRTPEIIDGWLMRLDERINERIRQAQADRLHWELLYSSLLPLEAELLVLLYSWVAGSDDEQSGRTIEQIDRYSEVLQAYFVAAIRLSRSTRRENQG